MAEVNSDNWFVLMIMSEGLPCAFWSKRPACMCLDSALRSWCMNEELL
jgi:hypothetical protein